VFKPNLNPSVEASGAPTIGNNGIELRKILSLKVEGSKSPKEKSLNIIKAS
jgi:hypothetical protein